MSINPLDLQTVFSHINQIGKQYALEKENSEIRQDAMTHNLNEKSKLDSEDIPIIKDLSDGVGKINDNNKRRNPKKKGGSSIDENNDLTDSDDNLVIDSHEPGIGENIDILG